MSYAFGVLHLSYLHAHYLAENNAASWHILKATGFELDARRADLPTMAGSPDRFASAFPNDCWRFVRLERTDGIAA